MKKYSWSEKLMVAFACVMALFLIGGPLANQSIAWDEVFDTFTVSTESQGFVSNVNKEAIAAAPGRNFLYIRNISTNAMYLRLSTNTPSSANGILLAATGDASGKDVFVMDGKSVYAGAIRIISATTDSNLFWYVQGRAGR